MLFIWCAILSAALYGCANLISLRMTAPTVAQSLAASGIQPRQSYALSVGTDHDDSRQPVWAILDPSSYDGRTVNINLHVRQGDNVLTCTIPVQRQSIDRDADIRDLGLDSILLIKMRHFAGIFYDQATDYGGCVGLVLAITGPDVHPVLTLSAQDRARFENGRSS